MTCAVGRISIARWHSFLEHILRESCEIASTDRILDITGYTRSEGRTVVPRFLTAFRRAPIGAPPVPPPLRSPGSPVERRDWLCNGTNQRRAQAKPPVGGPGSCGLFTARPNLKDFSLKLGEVLQEPGEHFNQVYFPQTGMISLLAVMENGMAVETATVGREGAVGANAGLGSRIAPHRSVVQMEGTATRIAAAEFQAAVDKSTSLKSLVARSSDS